MHGVQFIKRYKTLTAVAVILALGLVLYAVHVKLVANIAFTLMGIYVVIPMAKEMIESIKEKEYGLDLLALTAIVASLLMGEFLAAIVVMLMITGGEALEDYAQEKAKKELTELLKRAPKIAHKKIGKVFKNVAIDTVKKNDILLVKPGEVIPVDAVIVKGITSLDESALTGESLPVDKKIGDRLLSGAINQQASIEVRALSTSHNSQYEQIIHLVSEAASSRSPMVRLADRYSVQFTLVAFTLAAIAWIVSGHPLRALEVLVVATPCPLLIATPAAIVSGMSRAASQGIIIKNGGALETLAELKGIAFDKTGTLTKGIPEVSHIVTYAKGIDQDDVLRYAAAVEAHSTHSLAKSVMHEAKLRKVAVPNATKASEIIGSGVKASVSGKNVLAGKLSFLKDAGIKVPSTTKLGALADQTAIFVALDGIYIGAVTFSDVLRAETIETVRRLRHEFNLKTMMLTGDRKSVAERIAKDVGITNVQAECLPADKLNYLAIFRKKHVPLAFVGDGINDAPSLSAADVGIALGAKGSTAASESADVVIMLEDFSKVADSIHIGKRAVMIAKQSIFVGIGLSIGLMIFAGVSGLIKPVYGALLQELVDIIVILNALRAHQNK
jgi:heavy metal translocating P-type ATPase